MKTSKKNLAFTLVELLVVMSIISMLMSILLPSLQRSREQAHRIVCGSNIRNLTIAWQSYATDNDDRLCNPRTKWNDDPEDFYWVSEGPFLPYNETANTKQALQDGVLWPYLLTEEIYKCKEDRSERIRSYSLSATMGPSLLSGTQETGHLEKSSKRQFDQFTVIHQVQQSYQKMVFIDAQCGITFLNDAFHVFMDLNGPWASFDEAENGRTMRHNNGTNLSFADLHIEYWRWNDDRYPSITFDTEDVQRLFDALKGIRVDTRAPLTHGPPPPFSNN